MFVINGCLFLFLFFYCKAGNNLSCLLDLLVGFQLNIINAKYKHNSDKLVY